MSTPTQQAGPAIRPGWLHRPKRYRRIVMAAVVIVVIAGAGTACGGIHGGGSNSSADAGYAQCMQAHGVPLPGPSRGGPLVVPSGIDRNSPSFRKARAACQSKRPGSGVKLP